jgi:CMP-N-acetylneuraminic acid synthetase
MAPERVVALYPIKACSERIAGKNFRDFAGRPLFRWVLDRLLEIPEIERVVINTDGCHELAEHGVDSSPKLLLRDRRPELCGHHVSMNRILADDVENVPADVYVMTHATNPLLRVETIREALGAFVVARERGSADSLFAVNRVQARFYREDGAPINHDPEALLPTQQLEPWFEENSNLYLFTPHSFRASGARIGLRPMLFELPAWESVDIDDRDSWRHAELIARGLGSEAA